MTHNPPSPQPTIPFLPPAAPAGSGDTFDPAALAFLGPLGLADTAAGDVSFEADAPAPLPDIPGFDVLRELGAGGMGAVYLAYDRTLKRVVAVKMIHPDARPGPRELARFQAEATAVAAVTHENVVKVYSTGQVGDRPYFVMEYVAGGSLAARLAKGPLPPPAAAALVAATARGVHAAHAAGIIHRDIKPGNVLLEVGSGQWAVGSGRQVGSGQWAVGSEVKPAGSSLPTAHCPLPTPKVSDFGLAKRRTLELDEGAATRTIALVGTPAYMAPEQARGGGKFVGPEADVFALGVVLYECLTGRPPFAARDIFDLMRQIAETAPVAPRRLAPGVHPDLDLICLKCLSKAPADRYATAADLAADLDRFGAGLPVEARPIPRRTRAARWVRRNPYPAALAGLVALVLTGGPAAVVWAWGRMDVIEADAAATEEARLRAVEQAEASGKLAAARELGGIKGVVLRREADRAAGWTWANRADLGRAAGLAGGDPTARAELRAVAATALLAADLRPVAPVTPGFTAAAAATSADGRYVALGCLTAWGLDAKANAVERAIGKVVPLRVVVIDSVTGAVAHDVSFPAGPVYRDKKIAPDRVMSLAFSPDGTRLFVGTRSEQVVRLDLGGPAAAVGKQWKTPCVIGHLATTADGAGVLGAGRYQVFRWDAKTGTELDKADAPGACSGLAVEPGTGAVVAALSHGLVRSPVAKLAFPPPPESAGVAWVGHPVVLPGGTLIAAARNAGIELWDAATLRPVARIASPDQLDRAAHPDDVTGFAAHPSGAYLASASADRVVRVWAVASGQRVASVQLGGTGPAALAWSADGTHLIATGPNHTARYEFSAPAAEQFVGLHTYPLAAVAPAGGGRVTALGEFTTPVDAGTQLLFRTGPDGRPGATLTLPRFPERTRPGVAVNPATGAVAYTSSAKGVGRWNPDGAGPAQPLTDAVCRCPAFDPDGTAVWAVVASEGVRAWDATTGAPLGPGWVNDAGRILTGVGSLDALAVGRTVAVAGGGDGAIHLLGPGAAHVKTFSGARDPVTCVALTAADDMIAGGTQTGKLRLAYVDARVELPPVADAHPGGVTAVAFSPDGSVMATGGKDRVVRFWARAAGGGYDPVAAVTGLPAPVRSLAFERDRPVLMVLLAGERAARIWDTARLRADLTALGLGW